MANFCNPGDKPILYYRFENQLIWQSIKFGDGPIQVEVEEDSSAKTFVKTIGWNDGYWNENSLVIPANPRRKRITYKLQPESQNKQCLWAFFDSSRLKNFIDLFNLYFPVESPNGFFRPTSDYVWDCSSEDRKSDFNFITYEPQATVTLIEE